MTDDRTDIGIKIPVTNFLPIYQYILNSKGNKGHMDENKEGYKNSQNETS